MMRNFFFLKILNPFFSALILLVLLSSSRVFANDAASFTWRGEPVGVDGKPPSPISGPSSGSGSASNKEHLVGRIVIEVIDPEAGTIVLKELGKPLPGDSVFFDTADIFFLPESTQRTVSLGGLPSGLAGASFGLRDAVFSGGTIDADSINFRNQQTLVGTSNTPNQMTFNGTEFKAQTVTILAGELVTEAGVPIDPDTDITFVGGKFDVSGLTRMNSLPQQLDLNNPNKLPDGEIKMMGTEFNSDILLVGTAGSSVTDNHTKLTLEDSTGVVKGDARFGDSEFSPTDLEIKGAGTNLDWAKESGATQFGVLGNTKVEIKDGAKLNANETIIGFFPNVKAEVEIKTGAELKSKNATLGLLNTEEVAKVTLTEDSKWTVDGFLEIARRGKAELEINDNSTVEAKGLVVMSTEEGSDSKITVKSGETLKTESTFEVGRNSKAFLLIEEGGVVKSEKDFFVGTRGKGDGLVIIRDNDSKLELEGNLNIGNGSDPSAGSPNGKGDIVVREGGEILMNGDGDVRIGRRENAVGILQMRGPNSKLTAADEKHPDLEVGVNGTGTLFLEQGAVVNLNRGHIQVGVERDGKGDVTIQGKDTKVTAGNIFVGEQGEGELILKEGAELNLDRASTLVIADREKSKGKITLSGGDTKLTGMDEDELNWVIGQRGEGELHLEKGFDLILPKSTVVIGNEREGEGFFFMVGDIANDATLEVENMTVGVDGEGLAKIFTGGKVKVNEDLTVGLANTDTDSLLTTGMIIEGPLTTVEVGDDLIVGDEGNGVFIIKEFAELKVTGETILGNKKGSKGSLRLEGEDAKLMQSVKEGLTIGNEGQGILSVEDGAKAEFISIRLGEKDGGDGEIHSVGEGSKVTVEKGSQIGFADGSEGGVSVREKGLLVTGSDASAPDNPNVSTSLGVNEGSLGDATVIGKGSEWKSETDLIIGENGTGLVLADEGGIISATNDIILGQGEKGRGTLNIRGDDDGQNSEVAYKGLRIGDEGTGNIFLLKGGKLTGDQTDRRIQMGVGENSSGSVSIDGDESEWQAQNDFGITVGLQGKAEIEVKNGGTLRMNPNGTLAIGAGDGEGKVIVDGGTGPGIFGASKVLAGKEIIVGAGGNGMLEIKGGAEVKSVGGSNNIVTRVGQQIGGNGTVRVSGDDSTFETGDLFLGGVQGGGAVIEADDRAVINSRNATMESNASHKATATLDNSRWLVDNDLEIHEHSTLVIDNKSDVSTFGTGSQSLFLRGESSKAEFSVKGDSDVSAVAGSIRVDKNAKLDVENSIVSARSDISISKRFLSGGGTDRPEVSLSGGRLVAGSDIRINEGVLNARNVSSITADAISVARSASAKGEFFLDNSSLFADSMTVGSGDGLFKLTGTSVATIKNSLTILSNGVVDVVNGAVSVGSTTASLLGAVTVGPGGVLAGTGKIIGNLIVNGVKQTTFGTGGKVIPGESPGTLTVEGDFILEEGAVLDLEFAGTGPSLFDQIIASGMINIQPGSIINLNFIDGFLPQEGDVFPFLQSPDPFDIPTGVEFSVKGLAPGFEFGTGLDSNGFLTLQAKSNGQPVQVPEPGTFLLVGLGLLGARISRRFRR